MPWVCLECFQNHSQNTSENNLKQSNMFSKNNLFLEQFSKTCFGNNWQLNVFSCFSILKRKKKSVLENSSQTWSMIPVIFPRNQGRRLINKRVIRDAIRTINTPSTSLKAKYSYFPVESASIVKYIPSSRQPQWSLTKILNVDVNLWMVIEVVFVVWVFFPCILMEGVQKMEILNILQHYQGIEDTRNQWASSLHVVTVDQSIHIRGMEFYLRNRGTILTNQ